MSRQTGNHFEVLAQRGNSWTILGIFDEEAEAVEAAKAGRIAGGFGAVKVMRERFDEASGTFTSRKVFSQGEPRRRSKADDGSVTVAPCLRVIDFYASDGRATIGRLLNEELNRLGLTVSEMLHNPDNLSRVQQDTNAVQRAVQRAAIAQVKETGQSVTERAKELFALIDKAAEKLNTDWKTDRIPSFKPQTFDDMIDRLEDRPDRNYLLSSALVGHLRGTKSMREKVGRILSLVSAYHPSWVVQVADTLLGDLLSGVTVLKEFLGDQQNRGTALVHLADMSRGCFTGGGSTMPEDVRALNHMINEDVLPEAQNALKTRFIHELNSPRRLNEASLLEELGSLGRVIDHLRREDGSLIGGFELREVLKNRCSRYLNPDSIGECLRDAEDPGDRIHTLLWIEPYIVGAENKRRLVNYILPILASPDNETFFVEQNGTVVQRLQRLVVLQRQVIKSGFQEVHKRKMAARLDEFCARVLEENEFFQRLNQQDEPPVEKGIKMLKMCASGCFTAGASSKRARKETVRYLKSDGFLDAYLAGAADDTARADMLMDFHKLLSQAGIAKDLAI
ncbi:MAG: hypothetical protein MI806_02405 [Minwuiales bacterium]|nr:hypothetical protein [Minwuiales bacterium]